MWDLGRKIVLRTFTSNLKAMFAMQFRSQPPQCLGTFETH